MTRGDHRGWRFAAAALLALAGAKTLHAQAAFGFVSSLVHDRWDQMEAVSPNFFGPVTTARDPLREPYKEASGGQRFVQYFDKGRLEQREVTGSVTTGLLTVELKTGKVPVGESDYESRSPATIVVAGDAGSPGPTYADLAALPEMMPNQANVPAGYFYTPGTGFSAITASDELTIANRFNPPSGPALRYLADPAGHYGQVVYQPFLDYINTLPLGIAESTGYPIAPFVIAQITVGGKPATLLVQAFERRVLTFNPDNPAAFKLESGNIGQHYYRWRYGQ